MVGYTHSYSSGHLIPNLATATDWNIEFNCPLEYMQVSATTLVSLLWSFLIDYKIANTCFFTFFENMIIMAD